MHVGKPTAPPYPAMTSGQQPTTAPSFYRGVPGMPPPPPSYEESMSHPVPGQQSFSGQASFRGQYYAMLQ